MKEERVKELEDFANDFNKRLQLSEDEIDMKINDICKKLNEKNTDVNKRNTYQFQTISTSPTRSKSQFRPVNLNFIYKYILYFLYF